MQARTPAGHHAHARHVVRRRGAAGKPPSLPLVLARSASVDVARATLIKRREALRAAGVACGARATRKTVEKLEADLAAYQSARDREWRLYHQAMMEGKPMKNVCPHGRGLGLPCQDCEEK